MTRFAPPLALLLLSTLVIAAVPSIPPSPAEFAVSDTSGIRSHPRVVADGQGGAFVAWTQAVGGLDVYAQHVLSGGGVDPTWPRAGSVVCDASNDQSVESLIGDGQGGAIVAWLDGRGGKDNDAYVQRLGAKGRPSPGWLAQGVPLCTATGHQNGIELVSDGKGGAIAAWFDYRAEDSHIYAHHVGAAGAVDAHWPADGLPVCTAPGTQYFPKLVEDGSRGAIVTWYDRRNGSDYDIYAQHVLASGSVDSRWPAQGRALCTVSGDQRNPVIVTDGHGGALVAWLDRRREQDSDIYVQHVLASGAVDAKWPEEGLGLCTVAGAQDPPALVADGAGGAIAVWIDERSSAYDVYAQHALATGSLDPAWPPDALPVCTANQDKASPVIAADGSGGAFIAWQDHRSGADYDVYVQHVLARGVPDSAWPADGRLVASGPGDQAAPSIARLGANGFALTWEDARRAPNVEVRAVLAPGQAPAATSGKPRTGSSKSAH